MKHIERDPFNDETIIFETNNSFVEQDKRHWKTRVNEARKEARLEALNQRTIDRSQAKEKEYTVYSNKVPGLGMRVRASGKKTFVLQYKDKFKRTIRFCIGDPKAMPLAEAEERAHAALKSIRDYGNPRGDVRTGKAYTFDEIFEKCMAERDQSDVSARWQKQCKQIYAKHIKNEFGNTPIRDLTRGELLRSIKSYSSPYLQHHIHSVISCVLNWAVDLEYVAQNVVRGAQLASTKSRDRYLLDTEIASVWLATFKLGMPFGEYLRFLMLSGQRRCEVSNATWDEIDMEESVWTIPSERTKNGVEHLVPLSTGMREILGSLPRISRYVFQSPLNKNKPINSFPKIVSNLKKHIWVKNWRLHDLRRTLATGMAKIEISPHIIESVLNHRSGIVSGVAAVYNRYQYKAEKQAALENWNTQLLTVVEKHKDYTPPIKEEEVEL